MRKGAASTGFQMAQDQFLALLHHMAELLTAAGAGLPEGLLAFAAENFTAKCAAQTQRQAHKLKARALVRRALGHDFKAELQRFGHNARQRAIVHAHQFQAGTALAGDFFFRHTQKTLCNSHFVHLLMLPQSPSRVKGGSQSCHSAQIMYISTMRLPKYLGVYSLSSARADSHRKALFFAWELPDGTYAVQQLDGAFQPAAEPERVSAAYFSGSFRAEPSILAMPMTSLDIRLLPDRAGQNLAAPAHAPAPSAPRRETTSKDSVLLSLDSARKAKQVEFNLRETFRKTLLRLKRPRERQAAISALEQLASTTDDIAPAHKHMFRDFGVRLRKSSLPELALLFSRKALELAPKDGHAHFNLARILCILGMYDEAAEHMRTAILLDGSQPVYSRMLTHISKEKQLRPGKSRPRAR